jgi:hypothetical protein
MLLQKAARIYLDAQTEEAMTYDLQAEGTNGVTTTTGIDATSEWDPLTVTDFPGGVILHVDGRNAQSPINAIFGVGNYNGVGVFGLGGHGRAGPFPEQPGTGVMGVAGGVTNPPDNSLQQNSGVVGIGGLVGVFGQGDAIGVMGSSAGVGVVGSSHSNRGGVFSTGISPPVAQVQLVPATVQTADTANVPLPSEGPVPPSLPRLGVTGDVLAVNTEFEQNVFAARLWFCVQSGTDRQPAIWAEIAFSRAIEGTGS